MKKIIAFAGSNSSTSINKSLINYTAKQIEGVQVLDLTNYDIPMYSIDLEKDAGLPKAITNLLAELTTADAVIIATPEHNSFMPAYFKNILDWLSRTGAKYLENKGVLVMSVTPGNGGGKSGADSVAKILSYAGASEIKRYSFPKFADNFDASTSEISNADLKAELNILLKAL